MKIGTIISKENELYVVTRIENGLATDYERLQDYIARNVMIQYDGEYRTIQEIIDIHCDKYLLGKRQTLPT